MLDRIWLQNATRDIINEVKDNSMDTKRYISELYNTMMYIQQLFGQEMERWLLENHYKVEGKG